MNVWRLHTRNGDVDRMPYLYKISAAGVGWCKYDKKRIISKEIREKMAVLLKNNFDCYMNDIEEYYKKKISCLRRFKEDVKPDDLIWMRGFGKYYIGRVSETSEFLYNSSDDAYMMDSCHQWSNITWYEVGDESDVPGAVANAFIKGSAFQRINKPGIAEYSQLVYNSCMNEEIYKNVKLKNDMNTFYSLLTASDCEDLLCLWLYSKYGYICIPSTNKISTPLYECILKNPQNGNTIYVQVKQGKININADDYKELNGEVWLFTTYGNVIRYEKYSNIKIAEAKELFDFAVNEESKFILPLSIRKWLDFLG